MTKVEKPWGYYKILHKESNNKYLIKEITIKPRQMISLQKHFHRDELWQLIEGMGLACVRSEDNVVFLYSIYKDYLFIPCGELHRIENTSETEDLIFIEIQSGEKLDEDDIQRFSDNYGRIGKLV